MRAAAKYQVSLRHPRRNPPRLNALTMPVVWKGAQPRYTGRLRRARQAGRLLYDDVDFRVPMLEQQDSRRLRSHAALAYTVRGSTDISNLDEHAAQKEVVVFVSCKQFSQRFIENLKAAARKAMFCVSFLPARSVHQMIPLLQRLQHKGRNMQIHLPELAWF